ncbi:MAG: sugar ABC transporter permease [Thermoanaerobaculia bacterium]|jgi:arabinogalactan oligomer/maltooligosaccharide transport system permease protein
MSFRLRKTIVIALALGGALAALLLHLLESSNVNANARAEAERAAIVTLRAISDTSGWLGAEGEGVRAAVASWSGGAEQRKVRISNTDNRTIEASSFPEDVANGELPRRMVRDEKPIYDLGQELASAVEGNAGGAAATKEVVALEWSADGWLKIATPIFHEGAVVGIVQTVSKPAAGATIAVPWWPLAVGVVVICVVFLAGAFMIGERKLPLLAFAALLLVGFLVYGGRAITGALLEQRIAISTQVAKQVVEEKGKALAVMQTAAVAAPQFDASLWDSDRFLKPRGAIKPDLTIDRAKIAKVVAGIAEANRSVMIAIGLFAFVLFIFVGSESAAKSWAALVKYREAYSYVTPAMIGMLVLVFFPFFYGITLSFTDQNVYTTNSPLKDLWVGFKNYTEILGDFNIMERTDAGLQFNYKNFYWTLFMTVMWTVTNVSIGVSLGLLLALILNTKGLAFRSAYRVLLILPWAMPNYITALVWKGMFHQQFGVVNQVIQMFGGTPVSWFERPLTSFIAVVATNGWLSFPFMMVISLGALQSIPADLYEAARVDGASKWQQFTSITLPSLKPALVPAVILSVVWTFNMFNIIYLVSAGEPASSTEILITQAYKIAFEQYRYGYAAAYSTVIFMILLAYGTWQNRVTRATEGI